MSELANIAVERNGCRRQLLTTVSALALLGSVYAAGKAEAADDNSERPTVWIELGGQMERISGQGESFAPAFLSTYSTSSVLQNPTPLQAQKPPAFNFGEEGKISIHPEGSDWVFSAAIRYGRSSSFKEVDHQTNRTFKNILPSGIVITTIAKFSDSRSHHQESHSVLDFMVGKDVGLGLFGRESSSVLSFGVRFAQFASNATLDIRARPDLGAKYISYLQYNIDIALPHFHTYHATGRVSRGFRGIGPSLSWNDSAPLLGNSREGETMLDWGVNAALLFGKQKTRAQHQESAHYEPPISNHHYYLVYQHLPTGHSNARSVAVPNVGGFVGISYRIQDFKVSAGYRADFFFGAIDGGINVRKSETLGFYGPFATISVGLGE